MKNVIFSFLFLLGCSTAPVQVEGGKLKILATTAQVGDLVKGVGGDLVSVDVLIRGDLDPHSYEIVKGDGGRLEKADLIFSNGLGLEHGASLASYLHGNQKVLAVGSEIEKAHPEKILKRDGVTDPHIWMDVSLWREGVDPIVAFMSQKDPEGALVYQENGKILKEKMTQAHEELLTTLHKVPAAQRYLVTSHDAFRYFTRSYLAEANEVNWSERFTAPEGLAPEGQINAKDLQKVIVFLKEKGISTIFPESNVSRDAIRKIASAGLELGVEVKVCQEPLYGDAIGEKTYLEMMQKNAETIARNL